MDPEANPAVQLEALRADEIISHSHEDGKVQQSVSTEANLKSTSKTSVVEPRNSEQKDSPGGVSDPEDLPTVDRDFEDDFPEGGLQAWLVVASAFLCLFPSFGLMVSIGTLQSYLETHQLAAYTPRDVGWIPSVLVYFALSLGILVGPLFDRYGPRWIALIGSVMYVIMMFLLAECKTYWEFMLCLGVFGGISGATLTTTSLAVVSHWFKRRRGLTQGIAMIGSSFGGVTIPLILRTTLPKYGFKWSIRILAFTFLGCLVLGNLFMKPRLPPSKKKAKIISLNLYGDLRISLFALSVFGFEVVLFGALGILPTYASVATSFPADTGFYLISVMNGVSCFGRFFPGLLADHIGRFNVLGMMAFVTLIAMLTMWLPFGNKSLPVLYTFTAIFGFGTGSWMALVPACIGQLCRAEEFGRYYGTIYFIGSLSTLVCIPITGELVKAVGAEVMVGFMCIVLALSICTFIGSRWACLGWHWSWTAKV